MKKVFLFLSTALIALTLTESCTNDNGENGGGSSNANTVNEWIYEKMTNWYLWYDEMRPNPDYDLSYNYFFRSLLSSNDGYDTSGGDHNYFSYITRSGGTRAQAGIYELTHGMHLGLVHYTSTDPSHYTDPVRAHVLYVMPGSPADKAGIRRGDRIFNIDGTDMTYANYSTLIPKILSSVYSNGRPATTTVNWTRQDGTTPMGPATITPLELENNPVYVCKKIGTTGYLLYDSFETGGDSHPYDDALKRAIREELTGITDLVVDLRYNGGGYVSSCLLLSSIIAPSDRAGSSFMTRKYNDKHSDATDRFLSVSQMRASSYGPGEAGVNLGLQKIYVLTTGASASASECLIHCLRGSNVEVLTIGRNTLGKNVGMTGFKSTNDNRNFDYDYEMWPVTFYIYNAKNEIYTTDGLTADHLLPEELSGLNILYPLGDESEAYLGAALYHIENGTFSGYQPAGMSTRAAGEGGKPIHLPRLDRGTKIWESE